ncbi:unnamed protein product [Victoria cruziana]
MQMRCLCVTGINDGDEGDGGGDGEEAGRSTGGSRGGGIGWRKRDTGVTLLKPSPSALLSGPVGRLITRFRVCSGRCRFSLKEMASPVSSSKICFNPKCGAASSERWRKGWRLKSGDVAELCDRCGSAYDELRFCEDFHFDAAGWRNCETCGKRLHCGCIVSVHAFWLLDAGGVECVSCAKTSSLSAASNHLKLPSRLAPLPSVDCLTDQSTKTWHQAPVSNSGLAELQQSPGILNLSWNSGSCSTMKHCSTERIGDNLLKLEKASTCFIGKKTVAEKEAGGIFKFPIGNSEINVRSPLGASVQEHIGGLLDAQHVKGRRSHKTETNVIINELEVKNFVDGQKRESLSSCQNVTQPCSSLKENEARDSCKPSRSHAHEESSLLLQREYPASFPAGLDTFKEAKNQITITKYHTEGRARNQSIFSRYWPRVNNQEIQKISGDSNSTVNPLFEKTLSASDAGRIGRLVLPKKCAETYFPAISHPEGLPLRIQDANGKDWVFQFRFWPNNNSRMYVLEGVTSCIQSMQLQAGDVVTFSRIEPEGKLLMGFRKASISLSDQDVQLLENDVSGDVSSRVDRCKKVVTALPHFSSKSNIESANDSSDKRRKRAFCPKSRRPCVDSALMKVKMRWEEVQELLHQPPSHVPSIVIIEGHEFEEYEEPPVLGKQTIISTNKIGEKTQWVQCKDCSKWRKLPVDVHLPPRWVCSDNVWDPVRSSCSSAQEVPTQLEGLASKLAHKETHVSKKRKSNQYLTKLDEFADLALLDENEPHHHQTQAPTTRHPRHRPGCTCIVCIQPPSGQGPKHEPTCTCNVCLMVKRRFQTLMLRKKKRQSEKEAEDTQRKHPGSPEKPEDKVITCIEEPASRKLDDEPSKKSSDSSRNAADNGESQHCLASTEKGGGVGKAQIDLNCQPEREEDFSPCSDAVDMAKPFHDFMWMEIGYSSKAEEK